MSHTPGIWWAVGVDTGYTIESKHRYIADVHEWAVDSDVVESAANARLIAAAPDLLEACEAAIRYCTALTGQVKSGNFEKREWGGVAIGPTLDELFDEWMKKAFRAVAKAEGK